MDGEPTSSLPTITVSDGTTPAPKAKINSDDPWCRTAGHILYDLGSEKQVNGIAIQGHPTDDKWVKTFKVEYGSTSSSLTTYQVSGADKVRCTSTALIKF